MKSHLCLALLTCVATTAAYSKDNNAKKLPVQTVTAEPSHLTTRIDWAKFPKLQYDDADLNGRNRSAIVRIRADETGRVTQATVQETTGIKKLDQILVDSILKAKTKPILDNGNQLSLVGYQTFSFKLKEASAKNCALNFASKNWIAQQAQEKIPFTYITQPELDITSKDLNGFDRRLSFSFKVNKHGEVKTAKITKGSGSFELDQQVLAAVKEAHVQVPRKYWIYKKSKLKDEIHFDLNQCKS